MNIHVFVVLFERQPHGDVEFEVIDVVVCYSLITYAWRMRKERDLCA